MFFFLQKTLFCILTNVYFFQAGDHKYTKEKKNKIPTKRKKEIPEVGFPQMLRYEVFKKIKIFM